MLSYQEVNEKLQTIKNEYPEICEILIDWNSMRLKDYDIILNRINKLERELLGDKANEDTHQGSGV